MTKPIAPPTNTLKIIIVMLLILQCFELIKRSHPKTPSQPPCTNCELNRKLAKIDFSSAAKNNMLIVTQVNCGFLDFLENWILSLQRLKIDNVMVVANDKISFDAMENFWPGHVIMPSWAYESSGTGSANYGTDEYGSLVNQRPAMIKFFLDLGYDVVYSDVDSVWISNALEVIEKVDAEFAAASDSSPLFEIVDERDIKRLCTALIYAKATDQNRNLMDAWTWALHAKKSNANQKVFNAIFGLLDGGINFEMLEKEKFPPGFMYFETKFDWKNRTGWEQKQEPVIAHANWVVGSEKKIKMLQSKDLWKAKGAMPPCVTETSSES